MRTKTLVTIASLIASSVLLASCSLFGGKSLSEDESLACQIAFTPLTKINVDDLTFWQQQTAKLGWRDGGAFYSGVFKGLEENAQATDAVRIKLQGEEATDSQLLRHAIEWAESWEAAREAGHFYLAIPTKTINAAQMEYFTKAGVSLIEAGTAATKLRGRCLELGYKG